MRHLFKLICGVLLSGIYFVPAQAAELNNEYFSGTINTTVTSGITMRTEDNDCLNQAGRIISVPIADISNATGLVTKYNSLGDTAKANMIAYANRNKGGCATPQTDGYGNTSYNALDFGSVNADDGKLNFPDSGDFVDATQKFYSEITGTTSNGMGLNISFIGNYNPVLDLNGVAFKALTEDADSALESDFQLLDAYITHGFESGDNFVDVTLGRHVTSWGEATFIPIGMNGLVTNALDLTKLRAPGSSIRDALMPTEQVSFATQIDDWSIEAYYQFSSEAVNIDPKGSFFGSDIAAEGGVSILASGAYSMESSIGYDTHCTYAYNEIGNAGAGNTCNQASSDAHHANRAYYDTESLLRQAQIGTSSAEWATYLTVGATRDFANAETSGNFEVTNGLAGFTNSVANAAYLADNVYTEDNIAAFDGLKTATVELRAHAEKHAYAKDDGQFGIAARTYLDDVGTGVDLGFYYSNYHSKVPYVQIIGKGGVLAGDMVGANITAFGTYVAASGTGGTMAKDIPTLAAAGTLTAADNWMLSLLNGAMSSGVCGGFTAIGLANAGLAGATRTSSDGNTTIATNAGNPLNQDGKAVLANLAFGTELDNGSLAHDPTSCDAAGKLSATSTLAYIGYGATLLPAITPLNMARYQFIYPEDIQVFGASFNTNVGGTTVQGEVAYRPDFPLATGAGDQINSIGDASGTTAALTMFAAQSYGGGAAAKIGALVAFEGLIDAVCAGGACNGYSTFDELLSNTKRSSLATPTYSLTSDYRSKAYHDDMDVWTFDIGTTTSFTASDPITESLGADSSVLLTELGIVSVRGMDNIGKGFVARNGFNEGNGEHLCLGFARNMTAAQRAAVNTAANTAGAANTALNNYNTAVTDFATGITLDQNLEYATAGLTNMGASIVDALFGNGNYCESQMGADDLSATYRVIGSATYNNFNNSKWSVSPNFAWAHDFYGYGPSSIGGFVEDRQRLSLGVSAQSGGTTASLSYVAEMGPREANLNNDRDYVSASISHSF